MADKNMRVLFAKRPVGWVTEDSFEIAEGEIPSPGDGELLVRNVYLSADPYMRGRMNDDPSRYVAGFQIGQPIGGFVVGEVAESKADDFAAGDYVMSAALSWENYSVIPAGHVLLKPDSNVAPLSYFVGALGMPGMTAWYGLLEIGAPKEGETVFISAASGAVGQIVGQIAKMKGCRVTSAAGTDAKVAYLLDELDFDAAFNYRSVENIGAGLDQVCPDGIDIYFENVGGEMLDAVLARINDSARIVACGMISQYNETEPYGVRRMGNIVGKRAKMQGFIVSDHFARMGEFQAEMGGWIKAGKVKYREDIAQGIENAPKAMIGMLKGENFGKQVIQIGPDPHRG